MTGPLWPHLMRSMARVLREPTYAAQVWRQEHAAILRHILAGDPAQAEAAARLHAATASRSPPNSGNQEPLKEETAMLTEDQVRQFHEEGYLFLPETFLTPKSPS